MMIALENAYLQMRTAGLGYATHALEAQMDSFKVRMAMNKGTVEYTRPDGLVDGGAIIASIEFHAKAPEFDTGSENIVQVVEKGTGKETAKYVVAIARVD